VPAGPVYGFNRPKAKVSEGIIKNWWRQGMTGGAKTHFEGSQTDCAPDLKKVSVPTLVVHGVTTRLFHTLTQVG
jgi:non-heme chloroperoxidase